MNRYGLICIALTLMGAVACPSDPATVGTGADASTTDMGADATMDQAAAEFPNPDVPAADLSPPDVGIVPWPATSCIILDPSAPDPTEALFNPDCVLDISVSMEGADWYTLRSQTRSYIDVLAGDCMASPPEDIFTWFSADVSVGGQEIKGAGIRKKGFLGSLSFDKPSLKVRFDKFTDGQALSGMKRLTLNNMQQDPGLISACLAYGIMTQAGLPAPRCNFARVRVNDVDMGVYAHVESIKKPFIRRHFASDDGNLYEATISDFRPEFVGTWEKKTNETANDWSDIDAAVAVLELPDDELMAALEPIFDLPAFYTFWAAEVLLAHWDGYAGNTNNSYVYQDSESALGDGKFRFIPWGVDAAFEPIPDLAAGAAIPKSVYAFGHLAYRLYAHPDGRAAYVARLSELLASVWDEAALGAEVDRMLALLQPHLTAVEGVALAQKLGFRKAWINARRAEIEAELSPAPVEWTLPPRAPICWPKAGDITATFSTTWGSSGSDPFTSSGTVVASVAGIEGTLGNVSCNARLGTHESMLGEAVIEVIAQSATGQYFLAMVIGPPSALVPDTTYPIDWDTFRGFIGYFLPLENKFDAIGLLYDGTLSFAAASTVPGAPVSGTLAADVILAPQ